MRAPMRVSMRHELGDEPLPHKTKRLQGVLEALDKWSPEESGQRFAARLEGFDRFFVTLLQCTVAAGIINCATALLRMAEIVEEVLRT